MKRRKKSTAAAVTLKPFGRAAMLAYQPIGGGKVRYHAFKRSEIIEQAPGLLVIRCRVESNEIQD